MSSPGGIPEARGRDRVHYNHSNRLKLEHNARLADMPRANDQPLGRVYLVGAGPGDPGLLTLRGAECLRRADVVLYDYLVNPQILEHAPSASQCMCLGRHGQGRLIPQEEINQRMIELAQAGKKVVRLKAGDPAVFARAAEETEALTAAGVSWEIVPGITAALAAGSYAGVPLTHRHLASAVALVTGQEAERDGAMLDYAALARFPGTLVFYMGVTSAPRWSAALMAAGKSPDTPAALVRRCSWPDQWTLRCTLGTLAERLAEHKTRPPVMVIVGEVAGHTGGVDWFTSRPLFGRRIMITRPRSQAEALRHRLAELGADVLVQPAIEIIPTDDWRLVDEALNKLDQFDWVVFSSSNGVRYLLERLCSVHGDLRRLGGVRLAAIGPGTADELAAYHLKADFVPDEFRAESLAGGLAAQAAGRRFLLARASRGREVLADELQSAGGEVQQIVVYQSRDATTPDAETAELLHQGRVDWVTVTSSAIARSLAAMFGNDLRRTRLVSISPITSATLRELGHEPAAEARVYDMSGVVAAILEANCPGRYSPPDEPGN